MKQFMDKDFLLSTDMAKTLYHDFAENMPILDYHCHINPQEIYEDRKFDTITQVWLGGDHYKWRQMRSNGVDEKYVTGDGSDREKFQAWAETMPKLIGNPLYHWSHLELRRYFGYDGYLNGDTAEEVWNLCNAKLQEDSMTVRGLIKQSGVTLICTTDDPVDTLEWHQKIAADDTFDVQVLPAWRPDKAMNVEKPTFAPYIAQLSQVSGIAVTDLASLKDALKNRMEYFAANGCSVSDHALEYVMYAPASDEEVDAILKKGLKGEAISKEEASLLVLGNTESPMFPPELLPYTRRHDFSSGGMKINFLVNYSWEWDLGFQKGAVGPCLKTEDVSRIDLIIRWGGRRRLSGFLPVQSVYADFYVVDDYWPDFTPDHITQALEWYSGQDVTLGG